MTSAAWTCDSCDTNNLATATVCRVCGSRPGSASGQVALAAQQAEPTLRHEDPPAFVESKYKRPPTITLTSTTPRRPAPSPPRPHPPPRPPTRPPSGRTGRRVAWWFAGIVTVLLVIAYGPELAHVLSSIGSANSDRSATPPCPSAAAGYLPDQGRNSTLVVSYTSDKFDVTVCQDDNGDLYYDGQEKGVAASDQTHISIPATRTSSGYEASNNSYTYEVDPTEEILLQNGVEVSSWPLTRTGP